MDRPSLSLSSPPTHALYQAGTLTYTKGGLRTLALWLLWGDFAFYFFEAIFGRFLPIFLRDLHASNTLIGVMTGSFAGLVNVLFLPSISRWSDNFRSPVGRRIPLLYIVTPLTVGTVVAVGFAPEIGRWLYQGLPAGLTSSMNETTLILALLCFFVISFHFFNMVLVNAYNWLIRDVVPLTVMSRFLAWFSIVGTISGALFLWFVFPHIMTYRKGIFLSVGLFYLVAFMAMCSRVKEGSYPAPILAEHKPGLWKTYAKYFKECLQTPLYRNFFIASLLITASSSCAGNFITLFANTTLNLNMENMGHTFGWTAAISLLFYYPIGWLCDRFSPMHVILGAIITLSLGAVAAFPLVHGKNSFLTYSLAYSLPGAAWGLGQRATAMKLFPAEKFGQFSGGLNVFGCGALIAGNFLIGVVMDLTQSNYRVAFLWTAVMAGCAVFPMLGVLRGWKQHGGPLNYVAPLPTAGN